MSEGIHDGGIERRLSSLRQAIDRKRALAKKAQAAEAELALEQEADAPVDQASKPAKSIRKHEAKPRETDERAERSETAPPLHPPKNTKGIVGRSGKCLSGLTVKQEAFARLVASGANQSDAYRQSYNVDNSKPETIHTHSSKLAADVKVARRIAQLQQLGEMDRQRIALRSRERWYQRVWIEAEGYDPETGSEQETTASSRVSALAQLGKALRITDNQPEEQDVRDASAIAQEIADRLHALRQVPQLEE